MATLRFVGHVGDEGFAPSHSLDFAGFIGCHCGITGGEILADDMRPCEVIEEAANTAAADDAVQAIINFGIDSDGKFLQQKAL